MSTDRHRLCLVWLAQHANDLLARDAHVLHVAPEPPIRQFLVRQSNLTYIAGDKRASDHEYPDWVQDIDLCNLDFDEARFDLIICNHVLEHIIDDRLAMSEILRVLKPGGKAILQVPYTRLTMHSVENKQVAESGDRFALESAFGQYDHVRIYARDDYIGRLSETGFNVVPQRITDMVSDKRMVRSASPEEELFVCGKQEL